MNFNDIELSAANLLINKAINCSDKVNRFKESLSKIHIENSVFSNFKAIPDLNLSNVSTEIIDSINQSNLAALNLYKTTVMENRFALYNEAISSTEAKFNELINSNYIEDTLVTMLPAYAISNTGESSKHSRIILLRDYILNCIHRRIVEKPVHPSLRMDMESQLTSNSSDNRISSLENKLDAILKHLQQKNSPPPAPTTVKAGINKRSQHSVQKPEDKASTGLEPTTKRKYNQKVRLVTRR